VTHKKQVMDNEVSTFQPDVPMPSRTGPAKQHDKYGRKAGGVPEPPRPDHKSADTGVVDGEEKNVGDSSDMYGTADGVGSSVNPSEAAQLELQHMSQRMQTLEVQMGQMRESLEYVDRVGQQVKKLDKYMKYGLYMIVAVTIVVVGIFLALVTMVLMSQNRPSWLLSLFGIQNEPRRDVLRTDATAVTSRPSATERRVTSGPASKSSDFVRDPVPKSSDFVRDPVSKSSALVRDPVPKTVSQILTSVRSRAKSAGALRASRKAHVPSLDSVEETTEEEPAQPAQAAVETREVKHAQEADAEEEEDKSDEEEDGGSDEFESKPVAETEASVLPSVTPAVTSSGFPGLPDDWTRVSQHPYAKTTSHAFSDLMSFRVPPVLEAEA